MMREGEDDVEALTASFRQNASRAATDIAARLAVGIDPSRRVFAAAEFVGLPDAAFVARAYVACHGAPPDLAQFHCLRDRLQSGAICQTRLLQELAQAPAAVARGIRITGLRQQALRDGARRSPLADIALKAARLGRDILRLPRNLRRAFASRGTKSVEPASPQAAVPQAGKPRIAILAIAAPGGEMGGAERFYAGLRESLNRAGMAAEIVALESQEDSFAAIVRSYRRISELDLSAYNGVISSKAPSYAVRHPNHVCYLMHTMRAWYDMFEASHPFASRRQHQQRRNIQALDTAILSTIPGLLAIGEEVAQRLAAYNGLEARAVHLPSTLAGLKEGAFEYLFLPGRLHPWKRVDLAIRAMRFVKSDVRLVIAGTGQEDARLRAMAKSDSRIVFTGRVSDAELAALYADSAAVPFFPRREDLGLITLEAFTCGKPVITCQDSGEPARMVRDGISGFVCPPTPQAVAEKIETLLRDPARARAMGQAGAAFAAAINWDQVAATLIAALGFKPELR